MDAKTGRQHGWTWLLLLLLLASLSGCGDLAHAYHRTLFQVDCRQDKLVNGLCVPTR